MEWTRRRSVQECAAPLRAPAAVRTLWNVNLCGAGTPRSVVTHRGAAASYSSRRRRDGSRAAVARQLWGGAAVMVASRAQQRSGFPPPKKPRPNPRMQPTGRRASASAWADPSVRAIRKR